MLPPKPLKTWGILVAFFMLFATSLAVDIPVSLSFDSNQAPKKGTTPLFVALNENSKRGLLVSSYFDKNGVLTSPAQIVLINEESLAQTCSLGFDKFGAMTSLTFGDGRKILVTAKSKRGVVSTTYKFIRGKKVVGMLTETEAEVRKKGGYFGKAKASVNPNKLTYGHLGLTKQQVQGGFFNNTLGVKVEEFLDVSFKSANKIIDRVKKVATRGGDVLEDIKSDLQDYVGSTLGVLSGQGNTIVLKVAEEAHDLQRMAKGYYDHFIKKSEAGLMEAQDSLYWMADTIEAALGIEIEVGSEEKKGSFTAELVRTGASYYVIVTGPPGNAIQVTVVGTDAFTITFSGVGSVTTTPIDVAGSGVTDTVTVTDLLTLEQQVFTFTF